MKNETRIAKLAGIAADSPADGAAESIFAKGAINVDRIKAEYGIGRTMTYALMNEGKLPWTKVGNRRLIPRLAIERMLAEGLVGGTTAV